jgi:hypothetical protein
MVSGQKSHNKIQMYVSYPIILHRMTKWIIYIQNILFSFLQCLKIIYFNTFGKYIDSHISRRHTKYWQSHYITKPIDRQTNPNNSKLGNLSVPQCIAARAVFAKCKLTSGFQQFIYSWGEFDSSSLNNNDVCGLDKISRYVMHPKYGVY